MSQTTTTQAPAESAPREGGAPRDALALVILWSDAEPERAGEVAVLAGGGQLEVLGRGTPAHDGPRRWVRFFQQRPGEARPSRPLAGAGISREQLELRAYLGKDTVLVERVGQCPVLVNGKPLDRKGVLVPGDALLLKGHLLLYCARRPKELPPPRFLPDRDAGPFGGPDPDDVVGESPAAWELREQVAFAAGLDEHVLVLGDSGTGKELAAAAVHRLSRRSAGPFVASNVATLAPGLVEAELFGNLKNYPNPGTPERPGLVGAADGGTLFLDEIGEVSHEVQACLLRLLDKSGEYHRVGEARPRRADVRMVAATNRTLEELKHDLPPRLKLRIAMPSLNDRREDVPLLARAQLRRTMDRSPGLARRFLDVRGEPRVDAALVEHLVRRRYTTNVRELEGLLFKAIAGSPGDRIVLADTVLAAPEAPKPAPPRPPPSLEEAQKALEDHAGNVSRAADTLGITRFALHRLIKKHGLDRK